MRTEIVQAPEIGRAEARLPHWMVACAAAGTVTALLTGHTRFAAGFALGAALAILNYYWLHQAIRTLFSAGRTRVPKIVLAKFLVRYPLAFAGVYLFYRAGWLPMVALLAGLFVPVGGVLIEAVVQLRNGLRQT